MGTRSHQAPRTTESPGQEQWRITWKHQASQASCENNQHACRVSIRLMLTQCHVTRACWAWQPHTACPWSPCSVHLQHASPARMQAWWEVPFTSRRNIGLTMLGGSAALWLLNNSECTTAHQTIHSFAQLTPYMPLCLPSACHCLVCLWSAPCPRHNGDHLAMLQLPLVACRGWSHSLR